MAVKSDSNVELGTAPQALPNDSYHMKIEEDIVDQAYHPVDLPLRENAQLYIFEPIPHDWKLEFWFDVCLPSMGHFQYMITAFVPLFPPCAVDMEA